MCVCVRVCVARQLRSHRTCTGLPPAPSPAAAKYLKADAKPSDVPEFLREFQVPG